MRRPERRVYDLLCSHGQLSAREAARKLDLDREVTQGLIDRLVASGEVQETKEGAEWTPTVPF